MKRTLLLVCFLAVGGCSSTSFVGRRLDNFTAYYNTFYNAKKAYREAVRSMEQADQAVDRTTYLLVFDPGNRGSGTRGFENAVKKSADVLRGHPDSKWVDDALLLIGKSYYHMGNTVGAQQKFREVIDGVSSLEDEARYWLGLSLVGGGTFDEATAHLQASIDREGVSRKWQSRMRLVLGELYVRQERWEEAAEELQAGTRHADDDKLAGRAQFLLGQVLETLGDFDLAARAYRDVRRFKPRYELSYAAKFSAVRVQGEHGDSDEALAELRKMERDDKNFAYRAELKYLRGRIIEAAGRSEDARDVFYDVLYDSDASISAIRGPVHYHLGLLFRDRFVDFDLAAAHFDTAATSLARGSRSTTTGRTESMAPAPTAIIDAPDLAEVFGNYSEFHTEIQHYDSLLTLGSLDPEAFEIRIEEIRRQLAESIVEERRDQARRAAEAGFRGGVTEVGRGRTTGGGGDDYTTAGFLYHRDRSRVQDGLLSFFDRWGERPLVPNWRRAAAVSSAAAATEGESGEEAEGQNQVATPVSGDVTTEALLSSVEVDISEIPRTAERQSEMKRLRAAARYELANVLFLSIGLPDSAAVWYRRVLDEAQDEEIRARALYALAEVQQSLGDQESSSAIYQQVLDEYPESEVAVRSAQRLGREESEAALPEADIIGRRYQSAFDLWVNGSFEEGVLGMLQLAAAYPDTSSAARALLAAGAIYVDWADVHGRDILDPIAVDVPDSLWMVLGLVSADSITTAAAADSLMSQEAEALAIQPDSLSGGVVDANPLPVEPSVPDTTVVEAPPGGNVLADPPQVPVDSALVAASADTLGTVAAGEVPPTAGDVSTADDADSLGTVAVVDADEAAQGGSAKETHEDVYLIDLYRLISSRYPGSGYAQKSSSLAAVLEERLKEREAPDSVAVADSLEA
jgi:TolA-binding protein